MDASDIANLDVEFKRYLQILRPYLGQLIDQDVIDICNAWIQRLSDCGEGEKEVRNKYVFALCYQLARGVLEEPFLKPPMNHDLNALTDGLNSGDSSLENECIVIDADEDSKVHFTKSVSAHDFSHENKSVDRNSEMNLMDRREKIQENTFVCYTCPEIITNYDKVERNGEFEYRVNTLIQKLREIKIQNKQLRNELRVLREGANLKPVEYFNESVNKIDTLTNISVRNNESSATLQSLKTKLQEVQDSRNTLIDKIAELQDKLGHLNEIKQHEARELEAKHRLEIVNIKASVCEETKILYENQLEDIKKFYEGKLREIQDNKIREVDQIVINKDNIIREKERLLESKDLEIKKLCSEIDEYKNRLDTLLKNFLENSNEVNNENISEKERELEKRLNKMEKAKSKCAKVYEVKCVALQREKHLAECSLQLQLIRQRAQVVNEVNNETQVELTTALDKLETKYKEIVANVQATAIQRRMQDQVALESILQAACGDATHGFDTEIASSAVGNKVGNRSMGDESLGFCLNSERMGELFERVYIPQRDGEPLK